MASNKKRKKSLEPKAKKSRVSEGKGGGKKDKEREREREREREKEARRESRDKDERKEKKKEKKNETGGREVKEVKGFEVFCNTNKSKVQRTLIYSTHMSSHYYVSSY